MTKYRHKVCKNNELDTFIMRDGITDVTQRTYVYTRAFKIAADYV